MQVLPRILEHIVDASKTTKYCCLEDMLTVPDWWTIDEIYVLKDSFLCVGQAGAGQRFDVEFPLTALADFADRNGISHLFDKQRLT